MLFAGLEIPTLTAAALDDVSRFAMRSSGASKNMSLYVLFSITRFQGALPVTTTVIGPSTILEPLK